jgi:hypothetical protein
MKTSHHSDNQLTAENVQEAGRGLHLPSLCCVSLLDAETAPHDGTMILADFGWPWLVPAAWSRMSGTWQVAVYNASAETVTSTEVHDCWWEFETEDNRDLKGWMPIPPIPHNAEHTDR